MLAPMGLYYVEDAASTSRIEVLDSGAVRVKARIARTGVQEYPNLPEAAKLGRPVRVYRSPEEVFAEDSLRSLPSTAVTIGHPLGKRVSKSNWRKLAVGNVEPGHERVKEGAHEYIETSLILQDEAAISRVLDRDLTEVSQGYRMALDWTSGTTPEGDEYDAVQRNIRHNHSALLGAGMARAGSGARVMLDSSEDEESMEEKTVDLEKIRAEIRAELSAEAAESSAKVEADAAEAAKKAEAARAEAKEQAMKAIADAKDAAVSEMRDLADAKEIAAPMLAKGFEFAGKSAREIKLAAIKEHLPKMEIAADAADSVVDGAFDALRAMETRYVVKTVVDEGQKSHFETMQKIYNDKCAAAWESK